MLAEGWESQTGREEPARFRNCCPEDHGWGLLWGDSRRVRLKSEDSSFIRKIGLYPVGRREPLTVAVYAL